MPPSRSRRALRHALLLCSIYHPALFVRALGGWPAVTVPRHPACVLPHPVYCLTRHTCRTFDPVAPVIHEWTYEAMVYDLLDVEGNVFRWGG